MPEVKFLYMDEKYAEPKGPIASRVTSLTGVLVSPTAHTSFRQSYYELLVETMRDPPGTIHQLPQVHAAQMFPELGDDDARRFEFVERLVDLVVSSSFRIYRVGYVRTPQMAETFAPERTTLGLCFFGLLDVLGNELATSQIWPVMEFDGTAAQDLAFAGFVRGLDHYSVRIPASVSLDNQNIGEVLYSTKQSAYGAVADFASYLRHIAYLDREGLVPLTPFKQRMAEIARPLQHVVAYDQVITMKFSALPAKTIEPHD